MRGKEFQPDGRRRRGDDHPAHREFAPRLKKVKVYGGDYEKVVRKYDSKDTVFFPTRRTRLQRRRRRGEFDEERFAAQVAKGRFLITYGIRGSSPSWRRARTSGRSASAPGGPSRMRGVGGSSVLTQLLVANYEPTTKAPGRRVRPRRLGRRTRRGVATTSRRPSHSGTFGGSFHHADVRSSRTTSSPFAGIWAVLHAKDPERQGGDRRTTTTWCSSTAASRR